MTPTTMHSFESTAQHIRLIAERRRRLEQAQLEAEEQFVHAIARAYNSGSLSEEELERAYVSVQGSTLSGFATKRWQQHLAGIVQIRAYLRTQARIAAAQKDTWTGEFPIPNHSELPRDGIDVVYVLFDETRVPCYVGSTGSLGTRLASHARDGKNWSSWQAHRCRDRDHAYDVEEQFLQQYKPYLNKKTTR